MGLFDGVLLAADLDDTLLDSKSQLTKENIDAIMYFKKEGGIFTFLTGRIADSTVDFANIVKSGAPLGCQNGVVIYDYINKKNLYVGLLGGNVKEIVKFIYDNIDYAGIEIITPDGIFCIRHNKYVDYHREFEHHSVKMIDIEDIGETTKIFLSMPAEKTSECFKIIKGKYHNNEFTMVKSYSTFVEILPNDSNKGTALLKIAEMLGNKVKMTVSVGDNDNDELMIKYADIGFAVANATTKSKNAADYITVSNDENAIADIIYGLESGKYTRRKSK